MSLTRDILKKTIGSSDPIQFLAMYPHNAAPGHNLHSDISLKLNDGDFLNNIATFYKSFPFLATHPVPVYTTVDLPKSIINGLDPCLKLVKEKKIWEDCKNDLLKACDKSMLTDDNKHIKSNDKSKIKVHPNLAKLAAHMKTDPDQHFNNSSYNWYYTGGNIDILNVGDYKYLLRPNGLNGELLFSRLTLENREWLPNSLEKFDNFKLRLNCPDPPFQVDTANGVAVIRQKTNCHYLIINENCMENGLVDNLIHVETSSECPFLSVSLNKEKTNEFCTLVPDQELTIWDASYECIMTTLNLNTNKIPSSDSWAHAYYFDVDTVLFSDRHTIYAFDLRASNGKDTGRWSINKLVDACEEITASNYGSQYSNYVATNHHLLTLDMRQGWSQRWTHGSTCPPIAIKVLRRNIQDYIFLGSQRGDNVVFIENEVESDDYTISRMQPFSLPSLRESLHLARCNALCLDHLLDSRFTMSLTGLCCLEDKNINIIRCSSAGDIFWQKLVSKTRNVSDNIIQKLSPDDIMKFETFETKCVTGYELNVQRCHATNIVPSHDLIEYFYVSSCPQPEQLTNHSKLINSNLPNCRQLKTYRDYLAPKLLEAWGDLDNLIIDNDDDDQVKEITNANGNKINGEVSSDEEDANIEKAVSNWLDRYSQELGTNSEYQLDEEEGDMMEIDDPDEVMEEITDIVYNDDDDTDDADAFKIVVNERKLKNIVKDKLPPLSPSIKSINIDSPKKKSSSTLKTINKEDLISKLVKNKDNLLGNIRKHEMTPVKKFIPGF